MILRRPEYVYADNFSLWVHKNSGALARYWCQLDEQVRKDGGPAPALDEWPDYCHSQYYSWLLSYFGDSEWTTAQRTKDFEKDRALSGLGSVWDKYSD